MQFIKNFIKEEDGITAIEYALMAALIAGVVIAAVTAFGKNLTTLFSTTGTALTKVKPTATGT